MSTTRRVTAHRHCCTRCRATYEDNCSDRHVNATCNPCRSGHPSRYAASWLPVDCCPTKARHATTEEIKTYRLAGDAIWWICAHCSRTFGYHPGDHHEPARCP